MFVDSVIDSVRRNTDVHGLYYQNDVEYIHSVQKCIQNFKKEDVIVVIDNLKRLMNRQASEEVRALY